MLPDIIWSYQASQSLAKVYVTCIRTLADVLLAVPWAKEMYSELDKLLRSYFMQVNDLFMSGIESRNTYAPLCQRPVNNVMLLHT